MLSDEVIDKVVERITNRIEQGNEYILKVIGESIKKIGTLTPSKAQELSQIIKYGGDYEKIVKKLAEITKLNVKDIYKIFEEVAKSDYQFARQFYKYRNKDFIPYKDNFALQQQVESISRVTVDEFISNTSMLGYGMQDANGNIIYRGIRETYNQLIDEAIMSIASGKETFQESMYRQLKTLGSGGLKVIYPSTYVDKNGVVKHHVRRLDSVLRTSIKEGVRELHNANQEIIGEEIDADGIEISVHSNPAIDHEEVQGRQFSKEEYAKLDNGEEAQDYKGNTYTLDHDGKNGYRQISTLNCYHVIFSIVLGVSKPLYSDKELKQIIDDNNKGFEFEGKHYSMYEGTQLLRQIETKIREQKDLQILAKASDNQQLIGESQERITQLTHKYRDVLKTSGLHSKLERAKVQGYNRQSVSNYKADKVIISADEILPKTLEYGNIRAVIPKDTTMTDVRVIAGYKTSTPIKSINKLVKDFPQYPQIWQKKVGTVKGKYNNYYVHWYSNGNNNYYYKVTKVKKNES